MKKNENTSNYLEKIPVTSAWVKWSKDDEGFVTLEIENKGIMNTIAQKLLKKPRISYIHLDETGSFVWPLIDGVKTIATIGEELDAHFGEKAHPLYERLTKFFKVLNSYGFIFWADEDE